jgi:hypothetical protein
MSDEFTSRPPTDDDFIELCKCLNAEEAKYIVVGGFAMIRAGYPRFTADIDLVVDTDPVNEQKVYKALTHLPDQAVTELEPGEIELYTVVRVADEITVDLMAKAAGLRYQDLQKNQEIEVFDDVHIPFASHADLWRMKANTHREKDRGDLFFLREWFRARKLDPPV